ncbi:hypothetical protein L1987_44936 [Smallanthus sonchifolius]|uniref:Uncharacterized protein n=1 Tax=Smallanthus sonchifolius TaxID=185202 RepID=A0ACB9GS46_9ASTR|nr:hypothetical protein L1987_44936 [Smallanthus sonchifolius]
MLHDPIGIPSCFSAGASEDHHAAVTKSGQTLFMSVYKTQIAGNCRCITVTWFKHLLLHGLSVSVDGPDQSPEAESTCKVELKPWCFWRKQGSKRFSIGGKSVDVFWDLKAAKFNGETEPSSEYYVAVVCDQEVVLLLGDLKKDAYRKTGCRPSLMDPILVSRKEHIFGKKRFSTRLKFHEKGRFHELSIECKNKRGGDGVAPAMEIRIDGHLMISVKHLQWKFRGNESIHFSKVRIEVFWDIHDWLFSPGLRRALFIFKLAVPATSPALSGPASPLSSRSSGSVDGFDPKGLHEFCLFLYAWKVE